MMTGTRFFVRQKEAEEKKPEEIAIAASQKAIEVLLEAQTLLDEGKAKKREQERKEKPGEPPWLTVWYTIFGFGIWIAIGYLVYKFITEVLL